MLTARTEALRRPFGEMQNEAWFQRGGPKKRFRSALRIGRSREVDEHLGGDKVEITV